MLEDYLIQAVSSLRHRNAIGSPKVLRCNMCGDSKSQPGATSAAILLSDGRWVYKCQRTGCEFNSAKLAVRWLAKTDSRLHERYKADCARLGYGDERSQRMMESIERRQKEAARLAELKEQENEAMDKQEYNSFRPLEESDQEIIAYLKKRMIDPLCFPFLVTDDESSRFHGCVIFPVVQGRKAVYWQGRKIHEDGGPKYLNKRNGKKGFLLRTPRLDVSKPVIVCEGPFSMLSIENSVCTFGVQYTEEQFEIIKNFAKPVFCYDNDVSGDNAGLAKLEYLARNGHWVIIWDMFLNKMNLSKTVKDMNDVAVELGRKAAWDDIEDCVGNDYFDIQSVMY